MGEYSPVKRRWLFVTIAFMRYVLGLESSCDETAAAVVAFPAAGEGGSPAILASTVYTQQEHQDYGGVVPEIAARAHIEKIDPIVKTCLKEANLQLSDIDAFTATSGPGLLGGLLVGVSYAKSLALAEGKPYIGANHLEGHALTCHLTDGVDFPYLLLLVSGGHCQFIHVKYAGGYETIGGTLDDAVGEAFDKVAKLMGLGYPGGPAIEKLAQKGNPEAFKLPIPLKDKGIDFSFSGLKTAARQLIEKHKKEGTELDEKTLADVCASFQETVARTLEVKAKRALDDLPEITNFVLAGGVAANRMLCGRLEALCKKQGVVFTAPPIGLCTDNAAMIAYAGGLRFIAGEQTSMAGSATPRWPLEEMEKIKLDEVRHGV